MWRSRSTRWSPARPAADSFTALPGNERIEAGAGSTRSRSASGWSRPPSAYGQQGHHRRPRRQPHGAHRLRGLPVHRRHREQQRRQSAGRRSVLLFAQSRCLERARRCRAALSSVSAGTRGAIRTRSSIPRGTWRPIPTCAPAGANPLDQYQASRLARRARSRPELRYQVLSDAQSGCRGGRCRSARDTISSSASAEGRAIHSAIGKPVNGFDAAYYLEHNPDVAAAGVDPLAHFNSYGWQEGRNPNAMFDTTGYLAHYADVAASGANPLAHYEKFGWKEGRDPSAHFDTTGYLAANPDVAAAARQSARPLSDVRHL